MTYGQTCAYEDCETMLEAPDKYIGLAYCKKHRRTKK
jgi:hypothetical protein